MGFLYFIGCLFLFQQTEYSVQEQLRVEYVLIDLVALDGQNRPIFDLKREDFVVKEGRKRVSLETFQILDYRDVAEREPMNMDLEITPLVKEQQRARRQQFIFALDQESLYLTEIRKSFNQLRRAIKETELPQNADYLLYSMESGVLTEGFVPSLDHFLTELTLFEDRLIERYGQELERRNQSRPSSRGRPTGGNRRLEELDEALVNCLSSPNNRGGGRAAAGRNECVVNALRLFMEDEEVRLKRVLGELEALAYRFEAESGLKSIFFISPGFSLSPGVEAVELAKLLVNQNTFGAGNYRVGETADALEVLNFPLPSSYHKDFRKVVHACTRNRVVFHSLDVFTTAQEGSIVGSVRPTNFGGTDHRARIHSDYLRQNSAGLERLATMSGGLFSRAPSLKKAVASWVPRMRYVYLLGYASPEGKAGVYRKIKIKVKRKGATLHYRRGYFSAN